jgi:hypothetical protein
MYKLAEGNPIWRFYYQGSNSHPVRRTVAVIEVGKDRVTGYELRHGNNVRGRLDECPVKSYNLSKIAKIGQLDARRPLRRDTSPRNSTKSTLSKDSLASVLTKGV